MSVAPDLHPAGEAPPEHLFLFLDPGARGETRRETWRRLVDTLPRLGWRSHLYLLGEEAGRDREAAHEAARLAAAFLREHGFASLSLHSSVDLRSWDADAIEGWSRLCDVALPFQEEAYEEQSEARLFLSPLLLPATDLPAIELAAALRFFAARLATPGLLLPPGNAPRPVSGTRVRFYQGREAPGIASLRERLRAGQLLESLLARLEGSEEELLAPCSTHLVLDEGRRGAFSCLRLHENGEPGTPVRPEDCPACLAASMLGMEPELALNGRLGEGARALLALASALGSRGEHGAAAELSASAARVATEAAQRAAARLRQGLALLELGDLAGADKSLRQAQETGVDPAFALFQRGRVQFAWRDWIEALERFRKALETGSPRLRPEDIHFEMAACHINLEEYAEARAHLEESLPPGEKAPSVSFYRGVCELGEGRVAPALALFREALALGPAAEDRGRILFYIGSCLKDDERYEEAVEVLREAIAADPEDLANHNLLGFCYYRLHRHEEAVACFRRAVEIDPRSAMDWANLGSNLRDLGRREEAIAMYEKALSLDPFLGFARTSLERLQAE